MTRGVSKASGDAADRDDKRPTGKRSQTTGAASTRKRKGASFGRKSLRRPRAKSAAENEQQQHEDGGEGHGGVAGLCPLREQHDRPPSKMTRGQGDKGTEGGPRPLTSSPCLLVPLSPCHPSPIPEGACGRSPDRL